MKHVCIDPVAYQSQETAMRFERVGGKQAGIGPVSESSRESWAAPKLSPHIRGFGGDTRPHADLLQQRELTHRIPDTPNLFFISTGNAERTSDDLRTANDTTNTLRFAAATPNDCDAQSENLDIREQCSMLSNLCMPPTPAGVSLVLDPIAAAALAAVPRLMKIFHQGPQVVKTLVRYADRYPAQNGRLGYATSCLEITAQKTFNCSSRAARSRIQNRLAPCPSSTRLFAAPWARRIATTLRRWSFESRHVRQMLCGVQPYRGDLESTDNALTVAPTERVNIELKDAILRWPVGKKAEDLTYDELISDAFANEEASIYHRIAEHKQSAALSSTRTSTRRETALLLEHLLPRREQQKHPLRSTRLRNCGGRDPTTGHFQSASAPLTTSKHCAGANDKRECPCVKAKEAGKANRARLPAIASSDGGVALVSGALPENGATLSKVALKGISPSYFSNSIRQNLLATANSHTPVRRNQARHHLYFIAFPYQFSGLEGHQALDYTEYLQNYHLPMFILPTRAPSSDQTMPLSHNTWSASAQISAIYSTQCRADEPSTRCPAWPPSNCKYSASLSGAFFYTPIRKTTSAHQKRYALTKIDIRPRKSTCAHENRHAQAHTYLHDGSAAAGILAKARHHQQLVNSQKEHVVIYAAREKRMPLQGRADSRATTVPEDSQSTQRLSVPRSQLISSGDEEVEFGRRRRRITGQSGCPKYTPIMVGMSTLREHVRRGDKVLEFGRARRTSGCRNNTPIIIAYAHLRYVLEHMFRRPRPLTECTYYSLSIITTFRSRRGILDQAPGLDLLATQKPEAVAKDGSTALFLDIAASHHELPEQMMGQRLGGRIAEVLEMHTEEKAMWAQRAQSAVLEGEEYLRAARREVVVLYSLIHPKERTGVNLTKVLMRMAIAGAQSFVCGTVNTVSSLVEKDFLFDLEATIVYQVVRTSRNSRHQVLLVRPADTWCCTWCRIWYRTWYRT
ncbi:uncharacterized protein MYCFIDRAFT_180041 [Pseudocercospora fijiensis CIRAD86]|uniref:Uncharacterized protein n=1 Tax=Pseudocercospora fijiensis (strain CIRAD86) TaxID=383855 RepID=M3AI51_PSEFD|nr:uncharacterized protein MYCFIDRAFT_180041 [Pseudocercospora fijiensis CIRAD86]EME77167.1 hypothetical protein MYCFIDRAFT_180041 [Pseudocercospora fijiensis CIRAD86]